MYWNDNDFNGHTGSPTLPSFLRRSLLIETLAWLSLIRPAYLSDPPAAGSLSQQSKSLRSYFNVIRSSVIDLPGMTFPAFSSLDTHILIIGFLRHPSSLEPSTLSFFLDVDIG